jgi:serine/threonine protein kinase
MDFSSYESSNELLEPEWSAVASALPSVFDSAAISDPLIRDDDLFEASKIHSLPRVDIESDTLFEFQPIFLGAGASYRVYMQKFKQWGKPVAVKHIKSTASEGNIENFPSLGRQRLTVLREIYSLCLFNGHPNITNLLAWGQHNLGELTAFLITDYASLGSLDSFLRENRGGLKADHLFKICANVAEGIHAMHSQRMVHGDVKTANILIFEDACDRGQFTAKISDLGFSISLDFDDGDACYRGTNLYNAPEVKGQGSRRLQDLDFLACDVYSYGLLVWSVFKYGDFFLKDLSTFTVGDSSEEQMLDSVSALQLLEHAVEFAWARDSRDEAKVLNDVLSACLQADPVARLSIRSICRILNASAPQL